MPHFTVKLNKEIIPCDLFSGAVTIRYKDKSYMIEPDKKGWKQVLGNLDDKTVQQIGKAIEKYLKGKV